MPNLPKPKVAEQEPEVAPPEGQEPEATPLIASAR
jgi:hypothetical protein